MSYITRRKNRLELFSAHDSAVINSHIEFIEYIGENNSNDDYYSDRLGQTKVCKVKPKYPLEQITHNKYTMGYLSFNISGDFLIIKGDGHILLTNKNIHSIPSNIIFDNVGDVYFGFNHLTALPSNIIFTSNVKNVDFFNNDLKTIHHSCQFHNRNDVDFGQNKFITLPAALYKNNDNLLFDYNDINAISLGAKIYSNSLSIEFNPNLTKLPKNLTFHCKEILISAKDHLLLSSNNIGNKQRNTLVYNYNGKLHINLGCFAGSYSDFLKSINSNPKYNDTSLNKIFLKHRYIYKVKQLFKMASIYYSLPIL